MNTIEGIEQVLARHSKLVELNKWDSHPSNWVLFRDSELLAGMHPCYEHIMTIEQFSREIDKLKTKLHIKDVKFIYDDVLEVFVIDKKDWLKIK